jgi:hypothetical protein
MSCYIISIGGSGARVAEAFIHLAAAGLAGTEKVQFLFIDPDESNGNLRRTQETLRDYQACRSCVVAGTAPTLDWLRTSLESSVSWSPFGTTGGNKTLADFFHYASYEASSGLKHLFDVLYTEEERRADLEVGFRGRPAIGAAVMSQVNLGDKNQEPWRSLIQKIDTDLGSGGKSPRVFLCGSIFGGTGASGFPTLGRLLDNLLREKNIREKVTLGGLLMLPYFQFEPSPEEVPGDIYAKPEMFLVNTQAALHYYKQQKIFDNIFLLGDEDPASVGKFSLGKNTQDNDPHFIELFAAFATRAFLAEQVNERVVLLSRAQNGQITWGDIPDKAETRPALVTLTRFAWVWKYVFAPELNLAKQNRGNLSNLLKFQPWSGSYFKLARLLGGRNLPELTDDAEQTALATITAWCDRYLQWLGKVHRSGGGSRSVQLFKVALLWNAQANAPLEMNSSAAADLLQTLVVDDAGQSVVQQLTVQVLKEKLGQVTPRQAGIVGLAADVYQLCRD